jgi:hypothetical protein
VPLRRPSVTPEDCLLTVWAGVVPAILGGSVYALLGGLAAAAHWPAVVLLSAAVLIGLTGWAMVSLGLLDVARAHMYRRLGRPLPQPVGRGLADAALRSLGL